MIPWSYKTDCCGGSLVLTRTDIVRRLTRKLFDKALEAGAEAIVVACPLCQSNLDSRQEEISREAGKKYELPILYFTELMGLSLGHPGRGEVVEKAFCRPDEALGFQRSDLRVKKEWRKQEIVSRKKSRRRGRHGGGRRRGGMQAALDLANSGFKVYLVEETTAIGGRMAQLDKTFPTNDCSMCTISPKLVETGRHLNIQLMMDTRSDEGRRPGRKLHGHGAP